MSALPAPADPLAPGVYPDIPMEAYHAGAGISSGDLKRIGRSPAHYLAERNAQPSRALTLGSALHALRQGQTEFDRLFVVRAPDIDGRTKEGKAKLKALADTGKAILTAAEYAACRGMVAALLAQPLVGRMMEGALLEASVYWIDDQLGELCKCRPDVWNRELGLILDYKTCEEAHPEAARRQILRYGYHQSAAFYLDGTGARGFMWAFVEKTSPFGVRLYNASPELVEAGRAIYRDQLMTYHLCRLTDDWPCYEAEVTDIYPSI